MFAGRQPFSSQGMGFCVVRCKKTWVALAFGTAITPLSMIVGLSLLQPLLQEVLGEDGESAEELWLNSNSDAFPDWLRPNPKALVSTDSVDSRHFSRRG